MFAHLAFSYTKHELFIRKAPVATYWMHFKVNLICIKSFCPQIYNNGMVFVTAGFQWQRRHI